MQNKITTGIFILLFFSFGITNIHAQFSGDELPEISEDVFIRNVMLKSQPGADFLKTNILVQNGIIKQIGLDIKATLSAKIVEAEGLYLYSAFINPLSQNGLKEQKDDARRSAWRGAPGQTPLSQSGINPQNNILEEFQLSSKDVSSLHQQGFGLLHVVPRGFVMTGKGSIFLVVEKKEDNSHLLIRETGLFAQWQNMARVYPATPLATMAVWRDLIKNTRLQSDYSEAYQNSPEGRERQKISDQTLALFPIVKKDQPIYFNTPENRQILRAVRLAEELDLHIILSNISHLDEQILETLPNHIKVLPDLNWPDHPHKEKLKEGEDKEKETPPQGRRAKQASTKSESKEEKTIPAGMSEKEYQQLVDSRTNEFDSRMNLAAQLKDRNMLVGFSMLETKNSDLLKNIRALLDYGFDEDDLLAALTTQAATLFGIQHLTGTVSEGKQAHFVLFDQPFTKKGAKVQYIIIDGELFTYKKGEE